AGEGGSKHNLRCPQPLFLQNCHFFTQNQQNSMFSCIYPISSGMPTLRILLTFPKLDGLP
ncbi:hypothetical protein, partial [Tritonibacter mobilis]|uniref:hypothetical protein n=1 Tax=Tritonibacter mobilis TaxID=379347 RepID=UPI0019D6B317